MEYKIKDDCIVLEDENGKELAKVEFLAIEANRVDIEHTTVSDTLRGQGVAGKLMQMLADKLRAEDKKAKLTCTYAKRWFAEHTEYADLLD